MFFVVHDCTWKKNLNTGKKEVQRSFLWMGVALKYFLVYKSIVQTNRAFLLITFPLSMSLSLFKFASNESIISFNQSINQSIKNKKKGTAIHLSRTACKLWTSRWRRWRRHRSWGARSASRML